MCLVSAILGVLCMPGFAAAITIDATALTSPTFRVLGVTSPLSTATTHSVTLAHDDYAFSDEANGIVAFFVDASGLVGYDPAFENFLDGAGTTTLTVRGFDVTFDATALTCPTFRVAHVFDWASTGAVQSATMLPADYYGIDDTGSNQIVFHIDYDGNFHFVAGSEDYLFGAGTPNLIIRGFDFTVDARSLSSPTFRLLGHTPIESTDTVLSVTGIPGSYAFYDVMSNGFLFEIDPDGFVRFSAAYDGFFDGAGTTGLVVPGYQLSIEPCGLVPFAATFGFLGHLLDNASTATTHGIVGIPGFYAMFAADEFLWFQVDLAGLVFDLPASMLGVPVTGNGTTKVSIGSCVTVGSVSGQVVANCPSAGTPLYGVHVDAFAVGSGDLAGSTTTGADGSYTIADLPSGSYTMTCVTPLGYVAASEEIVVTISSGQASSASFDLQCLSITSEPRMIGFWKHQVGVATGGNGQAQVSAAALCSHLDLIAAHFNDNAINQVIVYQPPGSGACADKLQVAKQLLNLHGSAAMIQRARQQLMALLLNVASGKISQTQVISADGATVSQAITYCDQVIDSAVGDYELAKTIADLINNGSTVPAGLIPLGTAVIAYKQGMEAATFRALPSTGRGREFRFVTASRGSVRLTIHDVSGRVVAEPYRGEMEVGTHAVRWDGNESSGKRAASGMYFARLQTSRESSTLKVLHLRSGS